MSLPVRLLPRLYLPIPSPQFYSGRTFSEMLYCSITIFFALDRGIISMTMKKYTKLIYIDIIYHYPLWDNHLPLSGFCGWKWTTWMTAAWTYLTRTQININWDTMIRGVLVSSGVGGVGVGKCAGHFWHRDCVIGLRLLSLFDHSYTLKKWLSLRHIYTFCLPKSIFMGSLSLALRRSRTVVRNKLVVLPQGQ